MDYLCHYTSPLGEITLACDGTAITGLWFDGQKYFADTVGRDAVCRSLPVFDEARVWLDLYFSGRDPGFTPPLSINTTPFRALVWEILLTIPYGQTVTYGEIAGEVARRRGLAHMSAQAVGGAVGRNPISLIVPCHRVVGVDGSLIGYASGTDKKRSLLQLEKAGVVRK